MRTRYLLCYDVCDEQRLRRTAKVAEAWGNRIQYSVFVCDLTDVERVRLVQGLKDVLEVSTDRAFLVDLGPTGQSSDRRLQWVSKPERLYDPRETTIL